MSTIESSTPLPVGVVGCGRMGRLHARAYSQSSGARLVGVYDSNPENARQTAAEYGTLPFDRIEDLARQVRAVSIATPTQAHLKAAEPFLNQGIACLVEKPLAPDSQAGRQLVELARHSGAVLQVGHIERFNPIVRAMANLDLRPRFIETIRVSPMTFRSLDVGVVLDMMIHDIDIVLNLAGSKVKRIEAVGAGVLGLAEDVCNARLLFENGCVANLTASRLAMKTERKLRAFGPEAFVSIDYGKKTGVVVRKEANVQALRDAAARVRAGADPMSLKFAEMVRTEELKIDDVEPIRAQIEAFIAAARHQTPPAISGEAGLAAVEVAEQIVAAIGPDALI